MTLATSFREVRARLRRLPARDRRALRWGAMLLLPTLAWIGVVRPYVHMLQGLGDRIAAERALLDREHAVLRESPTLPGLLRASSAALEQWDTRFVRSPNPALAEAQVASILEEIARGSRVLVQEVRAMPPPPGAVPPEGLQPIRMSLRGESDFQGVLDFLNGMEQDPLLFRVVGLSVERPAGGSASGQSGLGADGAVAVGFVFIVEAFAPLEGH